MSHLPVLCALDVSFDQAGPVEPATFREPVKIRRSSTGMAIGFGQRRGPRCPPSPFSGVGGRFEVCRGGDSRSQRSPRRLSHP